MTYHPHPIVSCLGSPQSVRLVERGNGEVTLHVVQCRGLVPESLTAEPSVRVMVQQ